MRIDQFLAQQTGISRREGKELLRKGRVFVNHEPVYLAKTQIVPESDLVEVNGKQVEYQKYRYFMLHKPKGVISATEGRDYPTVLSLVPPERFRKGLFPVGRLDVDTTGLLLLTDDGAFAHRIISPKHRCQKIYLATLERPISEEELVPLRNGVSLADGTECLPAEVSIIHDGANPVIRIVLCEGKYHQVKRMVAAISHRVVQLHRIQIGRLALPKDLKEGECRELSILEKEQLFG